MYDYDGIVGLFSLDNTLSQKLIEKFNQKYLDVKVFQDVNKLNSASFSYLVINLCDFPEKLFDISNHIAGLECKILVLHPLTVEKSKKFVIDNELQKLTDNYPNLGILLVPDLLGSGVAYNKNHLSHDLIMQSIISERVKIVDSSKLINSISVTKLAEIVIKETFSFGVSGQKIALIGPRKTKETFVKEYLSINKNNIVVKSGDSAVEDLYSTSSYDVDFSLNLAVKNTKNSFAVGTIDQVQNQLLPKKEKIQQPRIVNKPKIKLAKLAKIIIALFLIVLTPIYLILVSASLLYLSSLFLFSNNSLSSTLVGWSMSSADLSKNLSFGNDYVYNTANIVYKFAQLGKEGITLAGSTNLFLSRIMGNENYELQNEANSMSASLDKLHTDISFLQGEINDYQGPVSSVLKKYLSSNSIDIGRYKHDLYELKKLVSRTSELLGNSKQKKYLILFQNNMELRPTGGFIGSFALATFNKGRLTEIVVNDVYSADGQLKGHVDPPEPIRIHLGEGGWYLRDSNWDPDFPASAVKAEWFLEKTIGEKVDGVIAIDLYFVKRLVAIIGQINLADFNLVINPDNLYQVLQSEVEDEFFPGSIKKASILTALSRVLVDEIRNLNADQHLKLFKEIYLSLERKHIQIFLHDANAQSAISNLGYSGQLDLTTDCGLRCIKDSYSLVEANLGVNKSNLYITRNNSLKINIEKEQITHELVVDYSNSASPVIGNMGVYKNYARLIVPVDAEIAGIREYDGVGTYKDVNFDLIDTNGRREAGFLIDVLPSSKKKIQIVWTLRTDMLAQGGQYDLKIIKQSGTDEDPISININTLTGSLTGETTSSYNTTLATDFEARLFVK